LTSLNNWNRSARSIVLTLSIRPSPVTLSSSVNSEERLTFFVPDVVAAGVAASVVAASAAAAAAGDAAAAGGAAAALGAAAGDTTIRLCAMNVCPSRTARVTDLPLRL
jgi:hypothetical protein